MIPVIAVGVVIVSTLGLSSIGLRYARTTSNFFVASRSVHPVWNAFAVSGEAMSAASYLGLPALLMVFGVDLLWALIGWTVGLFALSLFIAAPVRRFGAYTIPEFIESRMDAPLLRPVVAGMVILATWIFLLAQLKGAGVIFRHLLGTPYWVGVVAVGIIVAINLTSGGMRGITFVQGFQFFFIFAGILVPFVVLASLWVGGRLGPIVDDEPPRFSESTAVDYELDTVLEVTEPTTVIVDGTIAERSGLAEFDSPAMLYPGSYEVGAGTTITWPAGSAAPFNSRFPQLDDQSWSAPFKGEGLPGGSPVYFAIATFVANAFGIMGLPHIVVRFHTNPTGREARLTGVWFLAMIVPYYAMLPLLAAAARVVSPGLFGSGAVDTATVTVGGALDGLGGELVTALVSAGAVAAFLSTSSGLLIVIAGAVSHDILGAGVSAFRRTLWVGAAVSIAGGLFVESINIASLIGWSSSIAASSICPLLILGIWWPDFTRRGAWAIVIIGGGTASIATLAAFIRADSSGWIGGLLDIPALWTVPLAFAAGIIGSRTDTTPVRDLTHKFALMHLPDAAT